MHGLTFCSTFTYKGRKCPGCPKCKDEGKKIIRNCIDVLQGWGVGKLRSQ